MVRHVLVTKSDVTAGTRLNKGSVCASVTYRYLQSIQASVTELGGRTRAGYCTVSLGWPGATCQGSGMYCGCGPAGVLVGTSELVTEKHSVCLRCQSVFMTESICKFWEVRNWAKSGGWSQVVYYSGTLTELLQSYCTCTAKLLQLLHMYSKVTAVTAASLYIRLLTVSY